MRDMARSNVVQKTERCQGQYSRPQSPQPLGVRFLCTRIGNLWIVPFGLIEPCLHANVKVVNARKGRNAIVFVTATERRRNKKRKDGGIAACQKHNNKAVVRDNPVPLEGVQLHTQTYNTYTIRSIRNHPRSSNARTAFKK
jgi:hypothetical protein